MKLIGRLDTVTAPDFEKEIEACADTVKELVLDLKELEYTSSAGLRVFLKAQKIFNKQGSMKLNNVNEDVMEVFDITGFLDILNVEQDAYAKKCSEMRILYGQFMFDALLWAEERQIGGLGIYMVKKTVDDIVRSIEVYGY